MEFGHYSYEHYGLIAVKVCAVVVESTSGWFTVYTLILNGWAVTYGTTRKAWGGLSTRPGPVFLLYQMVNN